MKAPSLPWGLRPLAVAIAVGGLVLTAGLSFLAATANHNSDSRLLKLQVREAASTVAAVLPSLQSQLNDALQVELDTGNPAAFKRFAESKVGAGGTFASISLWDKTGPSANRLALVGADLQLVADGRATSFLSQVRPKAALQLTGSLPGSPPRLGYADMPPGDTHLVVYAENLLPPRHQLEIPTSSAFADLNFALYLGPKASQPHLVESSVPTPLGGLRSAVSVPFGDTFITIVGSPKHPLAGRLSAALAWVVLAVGMALSLLTASMVEYVLRRRRLAEALAAENERLYVEQRDIAATLQHALLPGLPTLPAIEVAARYMPGVAGIEVGGDWYDVIAHGPSRYVFVVGDVSGRGLGAATTMAALRFATRAYVAQGDDPATVLTKLNGLLEPESTQRFATVLIGEVDVKAHRLTLANAGHLPPLLIQGRDADYLTVPPGPPVGVQGPSRPEPVSLPIAAGSTLLAFTDGLVERRGEHLEEGLERLRQAALRRSGPLESLLDRLAAQLVGAEAGDDMVMLGLRWRS